MSEAPVPHNIDELLSAFADGELDAAQNLIVLAHLEAHPEAFAYLRERQLLREATQKMAAADRLSVPVPEGLNAELNLAGASDVAMRSISSREEVKALSKSNVYYLGTAFVIAASVLIGLGIGIYATRNRGQNIGQSPPPNVLIGTTANQQDLRDAAIPAAFMNLAAHVHVDCSRVEERLHAGGYPVELQSIADFVKSDLHSSSPEPDLTAIGFHFVGAGPCAHPLEGTVHLLYRKDGAIPRAAISVFVQAFHGQFNLKPGRYYSIADDTSTFPMIAWRTNDVVYLLMADEPATANSAMATIETAFFTAAKAH